jgi:hypothetical protein
MMADACKKNLILIHQLTAILERIFQNGHSPDESLFGQVHSTGPDRRLN